MKQNANKKLSRFYIRIWSAVWPYQIVYAVITDQNHHRHPYVYVLSFCIPRKVTIAWLWTNYGWSLRRGPVRTNRVAPGTKYYNFYSQYSKYGDIDQAATLLWKIHEQRRRVKKSQKAAVGGDADLKIITTVYAIANFENC
jgi:hypothetical protein